VISVLTSASCHAAPGGPTWSPGLGRGCRTHQTLM